MTLTLRPSRTVNQTVTILCDGCRTESVHLIVAAVDYTDKSADDGFVERGTAQITKCQGCETIGFRQTYRTNELPDDTEELLFPPRKRHRLADSLYLGLDAFKLPESVRGIYHQCLMAIQHDLLTLAAMGIRAVVEIVCDRLKARTRNLADRIDRLVAMAVLTPSDAAVLHRIRILGNDAAHRLKAPTMEQLEAAMKVIDHLLIRVYLLPRAASALPRQKPKATVRRVTQGAKAAPAVRTPSSASKIASGVTT